MDFPARFYVHVKVGARKSALVGKKEDMFLVDIAAPAEQGKANVELVKFFSRAYKLKVRIVTGKTSRKKFVCIED